MTSTPHPTFSVEISELPSPDERAFTPVFDGLWGEGTITQASPDGIPSRREPVPTLFVESRCDCVTASVSAMAPRPQWKGYLKLSLVSCPVALYSATSTSQRIRFNIINKKTGNRVHNQVVDAGQVSGQQRWGAGHANILSA